MANLLPPNFTMDPRSSSETDRRYLLADSVAPSESASMIDYSEAEGSHRTPRAHSPVSVIRHPESSRARIPAGAAYERRDTIATPSQTPLQPYKGFPSEAHYLAALHAWAESKKFLEPESHLVGFYGQKTMEEYASAPKIELGIKKKWRARKDARRESKGKIPSATGNGDSEVNAVSQRRNTVT